MPSSVAMAAASWQSILRCSTFISISGRSPSCDRKSDQEDIKSKVTLRGVEKGINHYKPGAASYDRIPTAVEIRKHLRGGHVIILEQKNPIHSIFLFHDDGKNYMISYGKVTRINVERIAKTATKNSTYRGMVIIRRSK